LKHGAVGVESVQGQTEGEVGEAVLEPADEAVKGLEFAVLLGGVGSGVFDELGHDGEGEAVGGHQFGFEDVVVITGLAVVGFGEAVGAVSLGECEHTGAVHRDHEPSVEEAVGIEDLFADEVLDDHGHALLELAGIEAAKEFSQGVAVGKGLDPEDGFELGGPGRRTQQFPYPPPRSQPAKEEEQAGE